MGFPGRCPGTLVEFRKDLAYLDGLECGINTPESKGLAGDELDGLETSGGLDNAYDKVEDKKSESSK